MIHGLEKLFLIYLDNLKEYTSYSNFKIFQLGSIKIALGALGIIGDQTSPSSPTEITLPQFDVIYGCTIISAHPNNYGKYKVHILKNTIKTWFEGSSNGHSSYVIALGI